MKERKKPKRLYPYTGQKQFLALIYEPADWKETVQPLLKKLYQHNIRVWYPLYLKNHHSSAKEVAFFIEHSDSVLVFMNEQMESSPEIKKQIDFAVECRKEICCITPNIPDAEKRIPFQLVSAKHSFRPALGDEDQLIRQLSAEEFINQNLVGDGIEGYQCEENHLLLKITAVFFLLIALLAIGWSSGSIQRSRELIQSRVPIYQIADTQISQCIALRSDVWQENTFDGMTLSAIDSLQIYGNSGVCDKPENLHDANGTLFINGERQSRGKTTDLSGIENLHSLKNLALAFQSIADASLLANLTQLQSLDISYNQLTDISWLQALSSLNELDISGNPVHDFAILSQSSTLKQLGIAHTEVTALEGILPAQIEVLNICGCVNIETLTPLLSLQNLQKVIISQNMSSLAKEILDEAKFLIVLEE